MRNTSTSLLGLALACLFVIAGVPASAQTSGVTITEDGRLGIGTTTPEQELHIKTDGTGNEYDPSLLIEATNSSSSSKPTKSMIVLKNQGSVRIDLINTDSGETWVMQNRSNAFAITKAGTGVREMELDSSGDMKIAGSLITNAYPDAFPDYVFDPGYELLPLADLASYIEENRHLPEIPTSEDVAGSGINMTEMQIQLLRKVEELTLYTLAQEKRIEQLERQLGEMSCSTEE